MKKHLYSLEEKQQIFDVLKLAYSENLSILLFDKDNFLGVTKNEEILLVYFNGYPKGVYHRDIAYNPRDYHTVYDPHVQPFFSFTTYEDMSGTMEPMYNASHVYYYLKDWIEHARNNKFKPGCVTEVFLEGEPEVPLKLPKED